MQYRRRSDGVLRRSPENPVGSTTDLPGGEIVQTWSGKTHVGATNMHNAQINLICDGHATAATDLWALLSTE